MRCSIRSRLGIGNLHQVTLLAFLLASALLAPEARAVDLGDLNIPPERIPDWYAFDETTYRAAQSWPEYDVTCSAGPCVSGKNPYTLLTGVGGCSAVTTNNFSGMDCIIDRASENNIVLYIPAGTYEIDTGERLSISRSDIVIRGAGPSSTVLEAQSLSHTNPCNAGNGQALIFAVCNPAYDDGAAVSWTAHYSAGDTTVTVSNPAPFSVDGWIWLDMTATTSCVYVDDAKTGMFTHLAKVTGKTGNDITIDRGLRMKYDGAGCTGFSARPYVPVENVGIEDLRMTTDTGIAQGSGMNGEMFVIWEGVADSWIVNTKMDRLYDMWMVVAFSARNWIQGNWFDDLDTTISFNTEGLWMVQGAGDIVIENNICTETRVCFNNRSGPEGVVHAYNYMFQPRGVQATNCERSYFNHGRYPREMLAEANDHNCEMAMADMWWGRQGPRLTAYRNRGTGTTCKDALSSGTRYPWSLTVEALESNGNPDFAADYMNIIGNTYGEYTPGPAKASTCPPSIRTDPATDTLSELVTNIWAEKNAYRYPGGSFTIGTSNNYSCGVSVNDSCPGTNKNVSAPDPSWNGTYPTSLYRTEKPSWWCQEACAWSQTGIGAFGDNFAATLCKLPAQIRYEGGTCTPVSGPPPLAQPPAAPILLD